MKQKYSFIQGRCRLCGDVDLVDTVYSEIRLVCGYGSDNDFETVEAPICGKCADKLYGILVNSGMEGE